MPSKSATGHRMKRATPAAFYVNKPKNDIFFSEDAERPHRREPAGELAAAARVPNFIPGGPPGAVQPLQLRPPRRRGWSWASFSGQPPRDHVQELLH